MVICEFGKDVAAFSATLVTRLPTFSCSSCRLLVPVWIRIWPGVPNSGWERIWSAASVVEHQIFDTFILGKRFCCWMNLSFESIRTATSVSFFRMLVWHCAVPDGEGARGWGSFLCCIFTEWWGLSSWKAGGISTVCVLCCKSHHDG